VQANSRVRLARIFSVGFGLALAFMMEFAASGDPMSRPTPEAPLPPAGPIYNEEIDAHLPPDLTGADRATVRYVMLKFSPAQRGFVRWVGRGNDLIIYLEGPPEKNTAYLDVAKSFDSNTYYRPETGETFATIGGGPPREAVRLEKVPEGWDMHPYVPAPRHPAPLADADIEAYVPAGLTPDERRDVENVMQSLQPEERRWIRWDYPPQPPPRSAHPAFGFVVYVDDPFDPDAPNVCYPNRALGLRTTQYWCPFYREALVDPTADVIGRAADATDYSVNQLDLHKVAALRPAWVVFPYTPPPVHPEPLTDAQLDGYIPHDLPADEATALRSILIQQPPETRRWFGWATADTVGAKCKPTCTDMEATAPAGREFVVYFNSPEILLHQVQAGDRDLGQPLETAVGPKYCMQNLVGSPEKHTVLPGMIDPQAHIDHFYCPFYHKVVIGASNPLWTWPVYTIPLVPRE
jgi:hypothetical protein